MFKNFLMKQMLKRQLKGVPEAEQERIITLVTENPELFEKIGKEIQEKTKATTRLISFEEKVKETESGTCFYTGKPAKRKWYFAKSY